MATEVPEGFTQGENKQAEMEGQVAQMMEAILEPEAKDRLKRVELVRKEKAMEVKMKLIEMAQKGTLKERVTEAKLCEMLEAQSATTAPKVSFSGVQTANRKAPSPSHSSCLPCTRTTSNPFCRRI